MSRTPICLMIDDGAPGISVYSTHAKSPFTEDGRPICRDIPNDFLEDFCNVAERFGIRGKLSVVPMPGGLGDIAHGIPGYSKAQTEQWLETVRSRVTPQFSLSPEMLTHAAYWDLSREAPGSTDENTWSQTQTRRTLTPYITRALEILKAAGLDITGVSSPWRFGANVQREYELALSDAMEAVFGKRDVWYALHGGASVPGYRPQPVKGEDGKRMVWFRCVIGDRLWKTMNTPDTSEGYISSVADQLITADGAGGEIIQALVEGSQVIFLTHWQSLYSNGTRAGLRALELAAQRIRTHLSGRVEWIRTEDLMHRILREETPEQICK